MSKLLHTLSIITMLSTAAYASESSENCQDVQYTGTCQDSAGSIFTELITKQGKKASNWCNNKVQAKNNKYQKQCSTFCTNTNASSSKQYGTGELGCYTVPNDSPKKKHTQVRLYCKCTLSTKGN